MFLKIIGKKRQVLISSCLCLGPLIAGYSGSWSGPIIPKLRDLQQSPIPYLLTEAQLSLVATILYLGSVSGPYLLGWLSNTKGRKLCLISGAAALATAYVLLATTKNLAMLYVGRFLTGIGTGTVTVMNMVYIGEIASTNIRGVLLTVNGVFFTVGSLLIFSIGSYVSYHGTTYIALALIIIYIIGLFCIPETPLFYTLQGRDEEALKVLQDLGRLEDAGNLLKIKKELNERNTKKEWKELFSIRSNRQALFIVVVINILQHCSGVMAVIFFSGSIFEMAGSSIEGNLAMVIIVCCQLIGGMVTPCFVESAGRKRILLISTALCSLSMFFLGLYFYLNYIENTVVNNLKWLPLVFLIVFYIAYDFGLAIIPNTLIGEVFTSSVRSKGSTVAMSSSWLFGFAVTTAFGTLLEIVGGHVAFWFFACTCATAFLFTLFFIPETKGKTLAEIQDSL